MGDKVYKNVQIEEKYHVMLGVVADKQHNSMSNVVESLIQNAYGSIPVLGTIDSSTGRITMTDQSKRILAVQHADGTLETAEGAK